MARRRDGLSRNRTKANQRDTRENGGKPIQYGMKVNSETRRWMESRGENPASLRTRGRRGVRARARQARIDAQRANDQQAIYRRAVAEGRTGGLIRQPGGGYTTNS